jgi:hypothetical protein
VWSTCGRCVRNGIGWCWLAASRKMGPHGQRMQQALETAWNCGHSQGQSKDGHHKVATDYSE